MKKRGIILFIVISLLGIIFIFSKTGKNNATDSLEPITENQVSYYTCGMHPSVRVSEEQYEKGDVNCPICNMKLTPVYKESEENKAYYGCGMEGSEHVFLIKDVRGITLCPVCGMELKRLSEEEAEKLKGVVSKVRIKGKEALLAGVKTEAVKERHLYKEIRTVGRVAYDPELAIAEEEFISAVNTLDKIEEGAVSEIKERSRNLVESSKRKLRLLGLTGEQIEELKNTKAVHTSLILPEAKMWIYGDVYEYELSWIKVGEKVKITTGSLPGEEFFGIISSINPVLDAKTRSLRFRAEIENPDLKLKPEMYVDVVVMSMYKGPGGEHTVLAVPKDAVLDTGTRKIVWLDRGNGEYEGRLVEIGPEATSSVNGVQLKFYPVLKGLGVGEPVVTRANFLIDSQSQISGVAASAYGGALEAEKMGAHSGLHQH